MIQEKRCVVVCLGLLFAAAAVLFAAERPEDAAQIAAESWLGLVDAGNYSASWEQAAKGLKSAVKQSEWTQTVGGVRSPLGRVTSRKLKSREYKNKMTTTTRVVGGRVYTLGGAGEYVVIAFDTAFAKKTSTVEEVVVAKDTDGAWRVFGYHLR